MYPRASIHFDKRLFNFGDKIRDCDAIMQLFCSLSKASGYGANV